MLTESQRENLSLWGYPHVMDDFRFHMTLTGRIDESEQPAVRELLTARFAEFTDKPLTVSGLALFIEETRGAPSPFTAGTRLTSSKRKMRHHD